jgi:hypothetical protein
VIAVDGRPYVLATHLMGAMATSDLGRYDTIVAALDMIFLGF